MSVVFEQAARWMTLDTPLGDNALLPFSMKGREAVNSLFEYRLECLSSVEQLDVPRLLGASVTLAFSRPGGARRLLNAMVVSIAGGGVLRSNMRVYELELAPSLWKLSRHAEFRIFEGKTTQQIVSEILRGHGVEHDFNLSLGYSSREYCVQFGETDLDFVSRLIAEEGMFFFFAHERGAHKLIFGDGERAYRDCDQRAVAFREGNEDLADAVTGFMSASRLTQPKYSLRDYDFDAPSSPVDGERSTKSKPTANHSWTRFVYPAGAQTRGEADQRASLAIEAADAEAEVVAGRGACASFTPGHRFSLSHHPVSALVGTVYTLTDVEHEAGDPGILGIRAQSEQRAYYRNTFRAIPSKRLARPYPFARKAVAHGPQTALVVEEPDDKGRIRVRFHWERRESSSCWVPVMQPLAGNGWGGVYIPRVGMEVVVHFLEGDPDKPVITGAIYNGENPPPWVQDETSKKTGLLSRSFGASDKSKANELSFEDKSGSEVVLLHAERDLVVEVENDECRSVDKDRKTTIGGSDTLTVEKDRVVKISSGDHKLRLESGSHKVDVAKGNSNVVVSLGNLTLEASAGKATIKAAQAITLECGSSKIEMTPAGVTISALQVEVKADAMAAVKGLSLELSGSGMAQLKGGLVKIN